MNTHLSFKSNKLCKLIACVVLAVFLIDTTAHAAPVSIAELTQFKAVDLERQHFSDLELRQLYEALRSRNPQEPFFPAKYISASVTSAYPSLDFVKKNLDHSVILIQDAHANLDAQKSIIQSIKHVQSQRKKPPLLMLEGSWGKLAPEMLDAGNQSSEFNNKAADELLKMGELTGAEHYAHQHTDTKIYGAEDKRLFLDNLTDFHEALLYFNAHSAEIDSTSSQLVHLALDELSGDLRTLTQARLSFEESPNELSRYLHALNETSKRILKRDTSDHEFQFQYPNLVRMQQLVEESPKLKIDLSVKQAKALKKALQKNIKERRVRLFLIRTLHRLVLKAKTQDFLNSQASHSFKPRELLELLFAASRTHQFSLVPYAELVRSLRFLVFQSEIDTVSFFDELKEFNRALQAKLDPSAVEMKGLRIIQSVELVRKLFRLEMTRGEFLKYGRMRAKIWNLFSAAHIDLPDPTLAEKFYNRALMREKYLVQNALKQSGKKGFVLVAGGFHTEGVERRLKAAGRPYVVLAPKIADTEKTRERYLRVMNAANVSSIPDLLLTTPGYETAHPFHPHKRDVLINQVKHITPTVGQKSELRSGQPTAFVRGEPRYLKTAARFALSSVRFVYLTTAYLWEKWKSLPAPAVILGVIFLDQAMKKLSYAFPVLVEAPTGKVWVHFFHDTPNPNSIYQFMIALLLAADFLISWFVKPTRTGHAKWWALVLGVWMTNNIEGMTAGGVVDFLNLRATAVRHIKSSITNFADIVFWTSCLGFGMHAAFLFVQTIRKRAIQYFAPETNRPVFGVRLFLKRLFIFALVISTGAGITVLSAAYISPHHTVHISELEHMAPIDSTRKALWEYAAMNRNGAEKILRWKLENGGSLSALTAELVAIHQEEYSRNRNKIEKFRASENDPWHIRWLSRAALTEHFFKFTLELSSDDELIEFLFNYIADRNHKFIQLAREELNKRAHHAGGNRSELRANAAGTVSKTKKVDGPKEAGFKVIQTLSASESSTEDLYATGPLVIDTRNEEGVETRVFYNYRGKEILKMSRKDIQKMSVHDDFFVITKRNTIHIFNYDGREIFRWAVKLPFDDWGFAQGGFWFKAGSVYAFYDLNGRETFRFTLQDLKADSVVIEGRFIAVYQGTQVTFYNFSGRQLLSVERGKDFSQFETQGDFLWLIKDRSSARPNQKQKRKYTFYNSDGEMVFPFPMVLGSEFQEVRAKGEYLILDALIDRKNGRDVYDVQVFNRTGDLLIKEIDPNADVISGEGYFAVEDFSETRYFTESDGRLILRLPSHNFSAEKEASLHRGFLRLGSGNSYRWYDLVMKTKDRNFRDLLAARTFIRRYLYENKSGETKAQSPHMAIAIARASLFVGHPQVLIDFARLIKAGADLSNPDHLSLFRFAARELHVFGDDSNVSEPIQPAQNPLTIERLFTLVGSKDQTFDSFIGSLFALHILQGKPLPRIPPGLDENGKSSFLYFRLGTKDSAGGKIEILENPDSAEFRVEIFRRGSVTRPTRQLDVIVSRREPANVSGWQEIVSREMVVSNLERIIGKAVSETKPPKAPRFQLVTFESFSEHMRNLQNRGWILTHDAFNTRQIVFKRISNTEIYFKRSDDSLQRRSISIEIKDRGKIVIAVDFHFKTSQNAEGTVLLSDLPTPRSHLVSGRHLVNFAYDEASRKLYFYVTHQFYKMLSLDQRRGLTSSGVRWEFVLLNPESYTPRSELRINDSQFTNHEPRINGDAVSSGGKEDIDKLSPRWRIAKGLSKFPFYVVSLLGFRLGNMAIDSIIKSAIVATSDMRHIFENSWKNRVARPAVPINWANVMADLAINSIFAAAISFSTLAHSFIHVNAVIITHGLQAITLFILSQYIFDYYINILPNLSLNSTQVPVLDNDPQSTNRDPHAFGPRRSELRNDEGEVSMRAPEIDELTMEEIDRKMETHGFPELLLLWRYFKSLNANLNTLSEENVDLFRATHTGPLIKNKLLHAFFLALLVPVSYILAQILFKGIPSIIGSFLFFDVPLDLALKIPLFEMPRLQALSEWFEAIAFGGGSAVLLYFLLVVMKRTISYSWKAINAVDLALMLKRRNFRAWFDQTENARRVTDRLKKLGVNESWDNSNYRTYYRIDAARSVVQISTDEMEAGTGQSVQEFIHEVLMSVLGQKVERVIDQQVRHVYQPGQFTPNLKKGQASVSEFVRTHQEEIERSKKGELSPEDGKRLLQDLLNELKENSAGFKRVRKAIEKIDQWGKLPSGTVEARIWRRDPWIDLTSGDDFLSSASLRGNRFIERLNRRTKGALAPFLYMRNKSISAMDFSTHEGRRVRVRMAAAVYKNKQGEKRPVLFVDGVEGRFSTKLKLIQRAVEDYAKACGFSGVFYFAYPLNLVPRRFADSMKFSGFKLEELEIEYADSTSRQYLDAFGLPAEPLEYAFPKGKVAGYFVDFGSASDRVIRYPSKLRQWWIEARKKHFIKTVAILPTLMFTPVLVGNLIVLFAIGTLFSFMLAYQYKNYRRSAVKEPPFVVKIKSIIEKNLVAQKMNYADRAEAKLEKLYEFFPNPGKQLKFLFEEVLYNVSIKEGDLTNALKFLGGLDAEKKKWAAELFSIVWREEDEDILSKGLSEDIAWRDVRRQEVLSKINSIREFVKTAHSSGVTRSGIIKMQRALGMDIIDVLKIVSISPKMVKGLKKHFSARWLLLPVVISIIVSYAILKYYERFPFSDVDWFVNRIHYILLIIAAAGIWFLGRPIGRGILYDKSLRAYLAKRVREGRGASRIESKMENLGIRVNEYENGKVYEIPEKGVRIIVLDKRTLKGAIKFLTSSEEIASCISLQNFVAWTLPALLSDDSIMLADIEYKGERGVYHHQGQVWMVAAEENGRPVLTVNSFEFNDEGAKHLNVLMPEAIRVLQDVARRSGFEKIYAGISDVGRKYLDEHFRQGTSKADVKKIHDGKAGFRYYFDGYHLRYSFRNWRIQREYVYVKRRGYVRRFYGYSFFVAIEAFKGKFAKAWTYLDSIKNARNFWEIPIESSIRSELRAEVAAGTDLLAERIWVYLQSQGSSLINELSLEDLKLLIQEADKAIPWHRPANQKTQARSLLKLDGRDKKIGEYIRFLRVVRDNSDEAHAVGDLWNTRSALSGISNRINYLEFLGGLSKAIRYKERRERLFQMMGMYDQKYFDAVFSIANPINFFAGLNFLISEEEPDFENRLRAIALLDAKNPGMIRSLYRLSARGFYELIEYGYQFKQLGTGSEQVDLKSLIGGYLKLPPYSSDVKRKAWIRAVYDFVSPGESNTPEEAKSIGTNNPDYQTYLRALKTFKFLDDQFAPSVSGDLFYNAAEDGRASTVEPLVFLTDTVPVDFVDSMLRQLGGELLKVNGLLSRKQRSHAVVDLSTITPSVVDMLRFFSAEKLLGFRDYVRKRVLPPADSSLIAADGSTNGLDQVDDFLNKVPNLLNRIRGSYSQRDTNENMAIANRIDATITFFKRIKAQIREPRDRELFLNWNLRIIKLTPVLVGLFSEQINEQDEELQVEQFDTLWRTLIVDGVLSEGGKVPSTVPDMIRSEINKLLGSDSGSAGFQNYEILHDRFERVVENLKDITSIIEVALHTTPAEFIRNTGAKNALDAWLIAINKQLFLLYLALGKIEVQKLKKVHEAIQQGELDLMRSSSFTAHRKLSGEYLDFARHYIDAAYDHIVSLRRIPTYQSEYFQLASQEADRVTVIQDLFGMHDPEVSTEREHIAHDLDRSYAEGGVFPLGTHIERIDRSLSFGHINDALKLINQAIRKEGLRGLMGQDLEEEDLRTAASESYSKLAMIRFLIIYRLSARADLEDEFYNAVKLPGSMDFKKFCDIFVRAGNDASIMRQVESLYQILINLEKLLRKRRDKQASYVLNGRMQTAESSGHEEADQHLRQRERHVEQKIRELRKSNRLFPLHTILSQDLNWYIDRSLEKYLLGKLKENNPLAGREKAILILWLLYSENGYRRWHEKLGVLMGGERIDQVIGHWLTEGKLYVESRERHGFPDTAMLKSSRQIAEMLTQDSFTSERIGEERLVLERLFVLLGLTTDEDLTAVQPRQIEPTHEPVLSQPLKPSQTQAIVPSEIHAVQPAQPPVSFDFMQARKLAEFFTKIPFTIRRKFFFGWMTQNRYGMTGSYDEASQARIDEAKRILGVKVMSVAGGRRTTLNHELHDAWSHSPPSPDSISSDTPLELWGEVAQELMSVFESSDVRRDAARFHFDDWQKTLALLEGFRNPVTTASDHRSELRVRPAQNPATYAARWKKLAESMPLSVRRSQKELMDRIGSDILNQNYFAAIRGIRAIARSSADGIISHRRLLAMDELIEAFSKRSIPKELVDSTSLTSSRPLGLEARLARRAKLDEILQRHYGGTLLDILNFIRTLSFEQRASSVFIVTETDKVIDRVIQEHNPGELIRVLSEWLEIGDKETPAVGANDRGALRKLDAVRYLHHLASLFLHRSELRRVSETDVSDTPPRIRSSASTNHSFNPDLNQEVETVLTTDLSKSVDSMKVRAELRRNKSDTKPASNQRALDSSTDTRFFREGNSTRNTSLSSPASDLRAESRSLISDISLRSALPTRATKRNSDFSRSKRDSTNRLSGIQAPLGSRYTRARNVTDGRTNVNIGFYNKIILQTSFALLHGILPVGFQGQSQISGTVPAAMLVPTLFDLSAARDVILQSSFSARSRESAEYYNRFFENKGQAGDRSGTVPSVDRYVILTSDSLTLEVVELLNQLSLDSKFHAVVYDFGEAQSDVSVKALRGVKVIESTRSAISGKISYLMEENEKAGSLQNTVLWMSEAELKQLPVKSHQLISNPNRFSSPKLRSANLALELLLAQLVAKLGEVPQSRVEFTRRSDGRVEFMLTTELVGRIDQANRSISTLLHFA